jgi:hypothetical protein
MNNRPNLEIPGFDPGADDPDEQMTNGADSWQSGPLKVVVVYDDVPAGQNAMRALGRMSAHLHPQDELRPVLWRFDLVEELRWRAIATGDIVAAGLIVLATSKADQWPGFINGWMEECLARKRGEPVAMLTLCGEQDVWAVWIHDRLQCIPPQPGSSSLAQPLRFGATAFPPADAAACERPDGGEHPMMAGIRSAYHGAARNR